MLTDMKNMMMKAWHKHYALLAISCMSLESAHAAIHVTERSRAPIILNLYQGHLVHFPAPVMAAMAKTPMESASVPVALVPDHGKNPDCIRQVSRTGFSGLVIDASALPLEESVRQTRAMMGLAASAQLCVEGELGHLADMPRYDQAASTDTMMRPIDMEPLIVQTGIGLLVVSVGMAYGMYAPGVVPAIGFQRLAEISHCSSVPLALHGGSGTSFDQLQLCTILGIAKINVGATIFEWGKSASLYTLCHDIPIELMDALKTMEPTFEGVITSYLQAGGSIGKA